MAPQTPTCMDSEGRVICGTPLERTSAGWRCPVCDFWYVVRRGKVAVGPLLNPPEIVEERPASPQPSSPASTEETFEQWLENHGGITDEMYKSQDDKTKWELKMAYNQRGKKDADFEVLPPQR